MNLTPLCELAKKYETDKGGWHNRYGGGDSDTCHNYTPFYYALFHQFRDQVESVLEIGVNSGASLRMWAEFFPKAEVFGLDCEHGCLFNEGRIRCFYTHQGSVEILQNTMKTIYDRTFCKYYDLIVDDGSHDLRDQIISMKTLLPYLSDRGMYIIEDLTIDCHPEWIGNEVPDGFTWKAIKTGVGIGKAHCPCHECGGKGPEQLVVIMRAQEGPRG